MNNTFEMGQTINGKLTIVLQKNIPLHTQPKKELDLKDPNVKDWMIAKHDHLCVKSKIFASMYNSFYYELRDDNNNNFEFQSKKELGSVGETIQIKNCRIKAKKTLTDGKVIFILANGTQKQFESYRKFQR